MPKKKTNEQFVSELFAVTKTIEPLEQYKGTKDKIKVKCLVCGYTWNAAPNNLLHGRGCKKCATKRVHEQQRKSDESFIQEVSQKNPYVEIISEYLGYEHTVRTRCLICGNIWSPYASSLLHGSGCPKCGMVSQVKKRTKSHEDFLSEMHRKMPTIIILGKYINAQTKNKVKCAKCGNVWNPTPTSLLSGHGCRQCAIIANAERNTMSPEEYKQRLYKSNPNILLLGTYVKSEDHIKVECTVCGHTWNPEAGSLLQGRGCPECAKKRRADKQRRTNESFVHEVNRISPHIEVLSEYSGIEDNVHAKCKDCGYEWDPIASVLLSGGGCPNCAGNAPKTHETFVKEIAAANPNITVIGRYINAKTPVTVKCLICGNEWDALVGNLRKGEGCPSCIHAPTSFAEQCLLGAFRKWFGEEAVLSRDISIIGKELDIYIPKYSTAIEIGSWYWHMNRIENDKLKRIACDNMGVRLIIIYDCFSGDATLFDRDFFTFPKDLGSERGNSSLKELAYSLALQMDNSIRPLSEGEWGTVFRTAYKQSRMVTTEDFRNRMSIINPNIEIVGEYTRARENIKCRCLICGNQWENKPYHLLNGQGCRECSKKQAGIARRKPVINIDTGELFACSEDAAQKYETTSDRIKSCCRGETKSCRGFRWAYSEKTKT